MVATPSLPHLPTPLQRHTHARRHSRQSKKAIDSIFLGIRLTEENRCCLNVATLRQSQAMGKRTERHAIDNKICIYFECDYNKILFDRLPAMINLIEADKHNQSMCLAITDCFIGGFESSYI